MQSNSVFNATVCLMGILILLVHIVNILTKKDKRKADSCLSDFFVLTAVHFATYLAFTIIKTGYTGNAFIISFYTVFYIMNNLEAFLLFRYMLCYVKPEEKTAKALKITNYSLFALFVVLDIVNIFTGIFFTAQDGVYTRSGLMIVSQGYQFVMFVIIFFVTITDKKLSVREKTAFGLYCVIPSVAIVLQNFFKGYAIAYVSIIIAIEVLFLFINVQKNVDLAREEEKNKDAQIRIMLSQIKPHFIYNSLSSISTLISIDPEKASAALDDFTEYMRNNLSSLTEKKLILFEDELKHIETYLSLEKMRFGDRVNVIYDISAQDFYVPPLSIQPIVENAVKHGITKKAEGGTLTLRAYETDRAYVVEIIDDGIGFDISDVNFDENKHFGINNIKYRIDKMCGGVVIINSEVGRGTDVTVYFFK